jgi:hypothetical protein
MKKHLGFNIVQPKYTPQPRRAGWLIVKVAATIVIGVVLVNIAASAVAIAWFGGFLPL